MVRGVKLRYFFSGLTLLAFVICSPVFLIGENPAKGNILGFIYGEDGTTPVKGAVVKFKNVTSGIVYESSESDRHGIFRVKGIGRGIYIYGVSAPDGNFNSDGEIGVRIRPNETAKMSIALAPLAQKVATTLHQVYKEQKIAGEALVGRVVDFQPRTKVAKVVVIKGYLRKNDKIHTKGYRTDFYQRLENLKLNGSNANIVNVGQTGHVEMEKAVNEGDLVYLVSKRIPFFLKPFGLASVLTASSALIYGGVTLGKLTKDCTSPK